MSMRVRGLELQARGNPQHRKQSVQTSSHGLKRSKAWLPLSLVALFSLTFLLAPSSVFARRLKLYSLPKAISPGQIGIIIFENPEVETPRSIAKCNPERLIGWVKSDIPILRIEQNGKQVWISLGSYTSMGDSCIASFLAPYSLEPGTASVFVVNQHESSVPSAMTITATLEANLLGLVGPGVQSLRPFTVLGRGFVAVTQVNKQEVLAELEHNIGYSKLSPAEQWTVLNRRISTEWDKLPEGNFLFLEQGEKKWHVFVEECGLQKDGLTLQFTAPPDVKPGPLSISLGIRQHSKEVDRTPPLVVTVQ